MIELLGTILVCLAWGGVALILGCGLASLSGQPTIGTYLRLGRWHRWRGVRLDRRAAKHEYQAAAYFAIAKEQAQQRLNDALQRLERARGSSVGRAERKDGSPV